MGYWSRVAKFPAPFSNDEGGFSVVLSGKAYIEASGGRLYSWDGVSVDCVLVADAPGAAVGLTDLCVHLGSVYGASLDGHVYKWNGATPAVSKGGTGAWINQGSVAFPLYSIGSHLSNLYTGSAFEGALYRVSGGSLTKVAIPLPGETELHFLLSSSNTLFTTTAYNGYLAKFTGAALQNLTSSTPKFHGDEIVYGIVEGSDGLIYGCSFGKGQILRWNGTDGWVNIYTLPQEWIGSKDLHFIISKGTKIFAIAFTQSALVSYDIKTQESKVEVQPSVHYGNSKGLFVLNNQIYATNNSLYLFVDEVQTSDETITEGDIKLFYGFDETDVKVENFDLSRDKGFETAVLISLFTNARATENDILPGSSDDLFQTRGGWWADNALGSKLWLLNREKMLSDVPKRAEEYVRNSLQWLIDSGASSDITIETTREGMSGILININIFTPKGDPIYFRYYYNWVNQLYRRI